MWPDRVSNPGPLTYKSGAYRMRYTAWYKSERQAAWPISRALDKRVHLEIIRDNFCQFCTKTYVVTPYLNRPGEPVQMRDHYILFQREIRKLFLNYHQILFLSRALKLSHTQSLTHCILVNSSTVLCWMSLFVILGVSGLFYRFYSTFDVNPVSIQCGPWSDITLCGVWSGPALFAYDTFTCFQVKTGETRTLNVSLCHQWQCTDTHHAIFIISRKILSNEINKADPDQTDTSLFAGLNWMLFQLHVSLYCTRNGQNSMEFWPFWVQQG